MHFETTCRRLNVGAGLVAGLVLLAASAQAAQTTGGVVFLDTLGYQKPTFVPLTVPTISTNYYIDMTSGSDSTSCGTSTSNPCKTLRGLSGSSGRNLSGLRGNSADGAAAINIRGNGTGAFYTFNETFAGTPGKEILIRPWGTSPVIFNRGSQNQGLNGTISTVHDIIIDGGDPNTGTMLFQFLSNNASCGGPCYVLNITGARVTVARTQFTATTTTGSGWVDLVSVNYTDGADTTDIAFVNNEFYDCKTGSAQCSAVYTGPCTASGGCSVQNFSFVGNVVRNMGGEGLELNPRVDSSNYLIEGNAIHNVGYATCNDGGTRSCRPAITLNINQSGAVNNVSIRNNLMWDTSSGCIWEKSNARGTAAPRIYNNTCYDFAKGTVTNSEPYAISSAGVGSSAFIQNNIIYSPNGANPYGVSMTPQASSNNICGSGESCGSSSRTFSSNTFISTSQSDPNFLKVGTNSEAVGLGVNLYSAGVTVDYSRNPRSSSGAFDVGGVMLGSGTPVTPPAAPSNLRISGN